MSTNDSPEPLVAADVDVGPLDGFMLDTVKLLGSELVALSTGDEFKAAVLLWCRAWKQVPAASLPDDDRILASFAGYGRDMKGWQVVREMALRGFIRCADGRWYHPVLAADAMRAHKARKQRQDAINKRWGKDGPEPLPVDTKQHTRRLTKQDTGSNTGNDTPVNSAEHTAVNTADATGSIPETGRDGTGRDSKKNSEANASGADAPPPVSRETIQEELLPKPATAKPAEQDEGDIPLRLVRITNGDYAKALFRNGLAFVAAQVGKPPAACRNLLGKWLKDCGDDHRRLFTILADAQRDEIADLPSWIPKAITGGVHRGGGAGRTEAAADDELSPGAREIRDRLRAEGKLTSKAAS